MSKPKGVMDGDARVKRWYEGWKAVIGFVIITIMIFSSGIKFRDWQLNVYSKQAAEEAHLDLTSRDSILTLRLTAAEMEHRDAMREVSAILDEIFCYLRRSREGVPELAWDICVRDTTKARIEELSSRNRRR